MNRLELPALPPLTHRRLPCYALAAPMADPVIDAHVHTYPSRAIGRQAMMGSGRTDYGGV